MAELPNFGCPGGGQGDCGGQSGNLGQRKRCAQKTSGTQGAGSPREDQSFLKDTEQSTHGGGAHNDSSKASSSDVPLSGKPTIDFKLRSDRGHTVESPLTYMQWKHLFNQEKELDMLCSMFQAKCKEDKDGNIIIFPSGSPQCDLQQWTDNILGKLKKLSSKICSMEILMDCQDLKHFEEQWSNEEWHKKNLVTCFYDRSSPRSTVIIFSEDEDALQAATKSANAILDSPQEVEIEVPLPNFDDQCFQHFIQPDKFPDIKICFQRRDGKTPEIKLRGLQAERDRAHREISQLVAALEMKQVIWPEASVWISRTENQEYLRNFIEKNQLGTLPIIGEESLFLIGPKKDVGKAQLLLEKMFCTRKHPLSEKIWMPFMQSITAEVVGEEEYFIPDHHLLVSYDPSTELLKLTGPMGYQEQFLQKKLKLFSEKACAEVQAASETESKKEISRDRLVTLLLMDAVKPEVNDHLSLLGKDLADVSWTVDESTRHLKINCKGSRKREEAEREIKSLFAERETIIEKLDKTAADRLQDSWPELVKDLREYDKCCFATFDPDRRWVLLATLRDRFDQTLKRMVDLMQFYQKDQAVRSLQLSRAQYKYLMKECRQKLDAVQKTVEKNGGTIDFQPVGDGDYWQVSVKGSPTAVSAAVHMLHQSRDDIHLEVVEAPDKTKICLTSTEKGRKFVSCLEGNYKCYIDFPKALVGAHGKVSGSAEVVLHGGTEVSLQHGPLKAEGVDLVAFPVPVEMDSKTGSTKLSEEISKTLKVHFLSECKQLMKGAEKVLLTTPPKKLRCRKVALVAVPSKWDEGKRREKEFVRSAVRDLMEMMMREKLSSVAFETIRHLPERAAEKQILVGLCEFFKEETGAAASPTGIKSVRLFTRHQTDPSQLLELAFAGLITSQKGIVVAGADKAKVQEAAQELSKFILTAPEGNAKSVHGRGTEEAMQNYSNMDVSTDFPSLRRRVCASTQESSFDEVNQILKSVVGCSISNKAGKLHLHFPTEKKDLAFAVCQHFDNLFNAVESGVPSLYSSITQQSEYDEILINAARTFYPNLLQKVKVTKKESGKLVLTPALPGEVHDLISSLKLSEVQVNDHEKEKAQTIHSVFQEADIHVEYVPSKKVVAAAVRKYDQLPAVISRIKVHLGQIKTVYRGKRQFTTQAESLDVGITRASTTAAVESSEKATEEAIGGDRKITLPGGLVVIPYKADITKLKVDAIVNDANERLGHGGGVARIISEAAGPDLDQEGQDYIDLNGPIPVSGVCITGPGRLPCTRVIHAVGPRWDSRTPEVCRKQLYDAVMNCCREADKWELAEIAMPPISAGELCFFAVDILFSPFGDTKLSGNYVLNHTHSQGLVFILKLNADRNTIVFQ